MKKKRTITKNRSSYKKSKRKNSRKKTNKKSRTRTLKKKELLKIITSLTSQKKKRSKKKKSKKKRTHRKGKRGGAISTAFGQPKVIPSAPLGGVVVPKPAVPEGAFGQATNQPPLGVAGPGNPGSSGFGVPAPEPQQDDDSGLGDLFAADDDDVVLGPGPAWQQAQQQYKPNVQQNVPLASFGGPQAVVDDPRPAYEKEWVDLNNQEKAQAEELEFSDDSWPDQPPNWVEWGTLENDKQLAAEDLGFTEELWKGLQFEVGETVERKNAGSPWNDGVVTNIIPLRVTILSSGEGEGIQWADVKKKQAQSIPAPLGYEKSWENLNAQERLGAQALDWDETTWESGIAPPNYVEWEGLSADKITAAEDLGFTQESWDNLKTKFSWSQGEKKIEVDDDESEGVSETSLPTTENPKWTRLITVKRKGPEGQTGETGEKGESAWGKLKGLFKGTEYEQFIEQSGLELKNLFTSYLTEYFQDIQKGEDVNVLQAKYESFIDKYYQEAIQKDKQLIQKLKDA